MPYASSAGRLMTLRDVVCTARLGRSKSDRSQKSFGSRKVSQRGLLVDMGLLELS